MPRDLPASWTADYLANPSMVTIVEVFYDADIDDAWATTSDGYAQTRRAFWSRDVSSLRTAQTSYAQWIEFDRMLDKWDFIDHTMSARELGQVGSASTFKCVIDNRPYDQGATSYKTLLEHWAGIAHPAQLQNRPARVLLMPDDASDLYGDVVPFLAGRCTIKLLPHDTFELSIDDNRLKTMDRVPRDVYSNKLSSFPGFRAQNNVQGVTKPWLFGEVPHAKGLTILLGYEDTFDLHGRRIEFAGTDEDWQRIHYVGTLKWAHEGLVDATESRGFVELNTDTGGWVSETAQQDAGHASDRSAHSKMTTALWSEPYGFYFDHFNEKYLYVKVDLVFSFVDTIRDGGAFDSITDPENVLDDNPATYATCPAVSESATLDTAYSVMVLPFPNGEGLPLVIEGTNTDYWRDRDEQPPTETEYGFFVFWKYDTQSKVASNGAYVFCNVADWVETAPSGYLMHTANGPAKFVEGDAVLDNFFSGDRELYRMNHRDNNSNGTGFSSATPMDLSDYAVRQGQGKFLVFGVCAPDGEGGGASAVAAGVRLYAIGLRLWCYMNFPDDGWYTDAQGYDSHGDSWSSVNSHTAATNPLDVLGLLMHYGLRLQEPGLAWGVQAYDSSLGALKLGRQVLDRQDGSELVDSLCKDCCIALWAGNDFSYSTGGIGYDGTHAVFLPKLGPIYATLEDDTTDLVPDSISTDRVSLSQVYTRFVFKYAWNELRGEYDEVVTISPTELELGGIGTSSWLDSALQATLDARAFEYNKVPEQNTFTYEFKWVHDPATAEYFIAFMVRNLSKQRWIIDAETGMMLLGMQMGDSVHVNWRDVPPQARTKGEEGGAYEREYVVWRQRLDTRKGRQRWRFLEVEPLERFTTALPS